MSLTDDPNDPRLTHGTDKAPTPQAEVYLVLSEEERTKGWVRPYRDAYRHVGQRPTHPVRNLTVEELDTHGDRYVVYEPYPDGESIVGRYWTEAQLDSGCDKVTTMGRELAETYARDPKFYGATYCVHCQKHLPVAEFHWLDGTEVGS